LRPEIHHVRKLAILRALDRHHAPADGFGGRKSPAVPHNVLDDCVEPLARNGCLTSEYAPGVD